jgi:signal transduction histidine kinase
MVMDMISKGIESLRRISTDLRPGILDDLGLVETMKWQIEEFEKRFSIFVSAELPKNPDTISPAISINLFRIFQETLTNIARHAEATHVEVALHTDNWHLYLKVKDNGKGFNAHEIKSKRTLGLLGMKERTLMIGGQFTMESGPGLGTTIEIEIPYDKPDVLPNPPI